MADINRTNNLVSELKDVSRMVSNASQDVDYQLKALKAGWSGESYQSFLKQADGLKSDAAVVINSISSLSQYLSDAARELAAKQQK